MIHLRRLFLGSLLLAIGLTVNALMSRLDTVGLWSPTGLLVLLVIASMGVALYILGWLAEGLWWWRG